LAFSSRALSAGGACCATAECSRGSRWRRDRRRARPTEADRSRSRMARGKIPAMAEVTTTRLSSSLSRSITRRPANAYPLGPRHSAS
jgi:hypothetical protein